MNRRDAKLDKYLGKVVTVTFWDYWKITGILEFDRPFDGSEVGSNKYSLHTSDGYIYYFRKSYVKKIKEVGKEKNG